MSPDNRCGLETIRLNLLCYPVTVLKIPRGGGNGWGKKTNLIVCDSLMCKRVCNQNIRSNESVTLTAWQVLFFFLPLHDVLIKVDSVAAAEQNFK